MVAMKKLGAEGAADSDAISLSIEEAEKEKNTLKAALTTNQQTLEKVLFFSIHISKYSLIPIILLLSLNRCTFVSRLRTTAPARSYMPFLENAFTSGIVSTRMRFVPSALRGRMGVLRWEDIRSEFFIISTLHVCAMYIFGCVSHITISNNF